MAVTTDDDGFREIQLNGKQLVFLFMAVTVVSVVIFLIGVLVGRGVRAERAESVQAEAQSDAAVAPAPRTAAPTTDEADPRNAQPPSPAGDADADTKPAARPAAAEEPPVAIKRAPVDPPAVAAKQADAPAKPAPPAAHVMPPPAPAAAIPAPAAPAVAPPVTTTAAADTAKSADPTGDSAARVGYAVQVAAVNARGEADTIVKRLSAKGYSAYVEDPKGTVTMYRVRVGTFKTRHEAQTTADRLKKEEKFKPWVTR